MAVLGPFLVTYKGLYMGGVAVVMAETDEQAAELVRNHRSTVEFEDVRVTALLYGGTPTVLFNQNGDY